METLTGERVCLRMMTPKDAPAIFTLFSDPEAMRYWSYPPYTELTQAEARLARDISGAAESAVLPWGVEQDGVLIGTVTLHDLNLSGGRAELGYLLAKSRWGQGLAQEAVGLAIDHAFATLGLRRLEADIDPRNLASQKLLERLGFVREGYLRERWCVAGEVTDTALYGLLAREWSSK
ncbi:GNAT family N-acetyltransferase [Armatimonas sp.]|uniref:GNAT family N-acetyltransferase n=1 Tax=Armatimonas sp. TaxID=1872638 RepID=UPI0037539748